MDKDMNWLWQRELTEEDFYGNELYEQLTHPAFDDYDRPVHEHRCEKQAKEIGGAGLAKLFRQRLAAKKKKDKESQKKRESLQKIIEAHSTAYTDLPENFTGNQPIGLEFSAKDSGIMAEKTTRDGGTYTEKICATPMLINRIAENANGILIELGCRLKGKWQLKKFPLETLTDASKISALLSKGIMIDPDATKDMAKFFQSMYSGMESRPGVEVPLIDHLGWDKNFKHFYFGDEKGVLLKGSEVEGSQATIIEAVKPQGDPEKSLTTLKEIRATKIQMAQVLMDAQLAAPMMAMVGKIEGFWVDVYGASKTGKSKAMTFAGSICGDMTLGKFMMSPGGSIAGKENRLGFLHHLPVNYDDYNNLKEREKQEFPAYIMFAANGIGRDILNRDHSTRVAPTWHSVQAITSEARIDANAATNGVNNRIVFVQAPDKCPWSRNQIAEWLHVCDENRGWIVRKWIEILKKAGNETILKMWLSACDAIMAETKKLGKVPMEGQVSAAAILLVADHLSEKYIWQDGITLSVTDFARMLDSEEEVDQNERFYQTLIAYFYTHTPGFDGHKNASAQSLGREFAGVYIAQKVRPAGVTPAYMCIPMKDLKTLIKEDGADCTLWIAWAKKKGLLHTEKDGRVDPKTKSTFLGSSPRLIHIALPDDTDAPAAPVPKTAALENAQKEAERVDIDKLPWGKESQGQQITMQDLAASEGGFVKIDTSLPCWEWDDATTAKMKKNQAMRDLKIEP